MGFRLAIAKVVVALAGRTATSLVTSMPMLRRLTLQGNYDLGWFWRCQKKNSYKVFKSKDETAESAIEDCVARNSGPNFKSQLIEKQKAEITQLERERKAALMVIEERDRLKEEVAEKRYG